MVDVELELSQEQLSKISKPLFYGLTFLSGAALLVSPIFAGTLLGQAVLAAIAFVAAGIGKDVSEDWQRFLNLISITAIMMVVLFAAYTAARLSMM